MSELTITALIGGGAIIVVALIGFLGQVTMRRSVKTVATVAELAVSKADEIATTFQPKNGKTLAETIAQIDKNTLYLAQSFEKIAKAFQMREAPKTRTKPKPKG